MNGCVFKRKLPSGKVTWGYVIDAGKAEDGKRKQIFKSGFTRKLDADIELAKIVTERGEGEIVRPDPRTFADFAAAWLSEYADVSCSPKTAERYREMMAHVCRAIGLLDGCFNQGPGECRLQVRACRCENVWCMLEDCVDRADTRFQGSKVAFDVSIHIQRAGVDHRVARLNLHILEAE